MEEIEKNEMESWIDDKVRAQARKVKVYEKVSDR